MSQPAQPHPEKAKRGVISRSKFRKPIVSFFDRHGSKKDAADDTAVETVDPSDGSDLIDEYFKSLPPTAGSAEAATGVTATEATDAADNTPPSHPAALKIHYKAKTVYLKFAAAEQERGVTVARLKELVSMLLTPDIIDSELTAMKPIRELLRNTVPQVSSDTLLTCYAADGSSPLDIDDFRLTYYYEIPLVDDSKPLAAYDVRTDGHVYVETYNDKTHHIKTRSRLQDKATNMVSKLWRGGRVAALPTTTAPSSASPPKTPADTSNAPASAEVSTAASTAEVASPPPTETMAKTIPAAEPTDDKAADDVSAADHPEEEKEPVQQAVPVDVKEDETTEDGYVKIAKVESGSAEPSASETEKVLEKAEKVPVEEVEVLNTELESAKTPATEVENVPENVDESVNDAEQTEKAPEAIDGSAAVAREQTAEPEESPVEPQSEPSKDPEQAAASATLKSRKEITRILAAAETELLPRLRAFTSARPEPARQRHLEYTFISEKMFQKILELDNVDIYEEEDLNLPPPAGQLSLRDERRNAVKKLKDYVKEVSDVNERYQDEEK